MASFCKVILIGNLTRDPEIRVTPKGTSICQFGMAVNRKYKSESGEQLEEVSFFDIEAWGKQGEVIGKFCTKGKQLFVEGRLKQDTWEDKTSGQKRSKIKVVLENFQFLGGGKPEDGEGGGAGGEYNQRASSPERHSPPARNLAPAGSNASRSSSPADNIDEDVPFFDGVI